MRGKVSHKGNIKKKNPSKKRTRHRCHIIENPILLRWIPVVIIVLILPWLSSTIAEKVGNIIDLYLDNPINNVVIVVAVLGIFWKGFKGKKKDDKKNLLSFVCGIYLSLFFLSGLYKVDIVVADIILDRNITEECDSETIASSISEENSKAVGEDSQDNIAQISIDWENDLYLGYYVQFSSEEILTLMENYTHRFMNGEANRPVRKTESELEEGPYGTEIHDANQLQEDRSKVLSSELKNYSIICEIKKRINANEISEEADNLKLLGTLYRESYDRRIIADLSENMTDQSCLERSQKYLIKALTYAYCDDYNKNYIDEIWKSILDNYYELGNLTMMDGGNAERAQKIAEAIGQKYN